jgi:hypothetical protein
LACGIASPSENNKNIHLKTNTEKDLDYEQTKYYLLYFISRKFFIKNMDSRSQIDRFVARK